MQTNLSLSTFAIASFENDSRSITWHQWHELYPTDRKTSLFSFLAFANASGPHGYQSTGLWACCRRYGLDSFASRFAGCFGFSGGSAAKIDMPLANRTSTVRSMTGSWVTGRLQPHHGGTRIKYNRTGPRSSEPIHVRPICSPASRSLRCFSLSGPGRRQGCGETEGRGGQELEGGRHIEA